MKISARILTGAAIGFLVIVAGLAAGFHFSTKKAQQTQGTPVAVQSSTGIISGQTETTQAAPPPANPNTYDVSPPSRASLPVTKDIDLPRTRPIAFVMMSKDEAKEVSEGQQVLLYDAHNTLIESFGTIREIKAGSEAFENMVTIHIGFDPQDISETNKAVRGAVITGRNPDVARLPLSALVKNDSDETHVWTANTDRDGVTTAKLEKINVAFATYDFFAIEQTSHNGGTYILNPDKKLKNGQKISVRNILYAGPAQSDESRVSERSKDRRISRDNDAAQKAALEGERGGGANNCGGGTAGNNSSCAAQPGAVEQFMRSIKTLAPTSAKTPSAQDAPEADTAPATADAP